MLNSFEEPPKNPKKKSKKRNKDSVGKWSLSPSFKGKTLFNREGRRSFYSLQRK